MNEHTPGPWQKVLMINGVVGVQGPKGHICTLEQYPEDTADCTLIAAAPELLAAAKRAEEYIRGYDHGAALRELVAAIKKAEGR